MSTVGGILCRVLLKVTMSAGLVLLLLRQSALNFSGNKYFSYKLPSLAKD